MKPLIRNPGMHHGTCVTHVPWCMSGSLTCGGRGKRSRHSRRMHNPQFYVSGKRPMVARMSWLCSRCWWAPWTSKCNVTDACCDKVTYPGREPPSRTTLSWSKIMLRPAQLDPLGISWRTRTWKSWIGHLKVRMWTPWNTSGIRGPSQ